jgi:hypothetical protein
LLQQGFDFARAGVQVAQQFQRPQAASPSAPSGEPGGAPPQPQYGAPPSYEPSPSPYAAPPATPNADPRALLQALQQRQIPPLPGTAPEPSAPAAPARADGMALLSLILSHPHFQQALQQAAAHGTAAPRTVALPVPSTSYPPHMRSVPIPLGAVLNAISALVRPSLVELNAATAEEDPEIPSYLVDDDGQFIVDPASSADRAALVAHLFRLSDAAAQQGAEWSEASEDAGEQDESEAFAFEAGFFAR